MNQPLCRYIDHAVLKPQFTPDEAVRQMQIGVEYNTRTLCVRPADIALAQGITAGTNTAVSTVLAFPHGNILPESKTDEAKRYAGLGVAEIDMVVNYSLILGGQWDRLEEDIRAVTAVAKPAGILVKTIFETATLTKEQIARATEVAVVAQADFVKTSTGFGEGGATVEAAQMMLDAAAGRIAVKASGGIRDRKTAQAYIDMGVARLGVGSTTTPVLCRLE
jgi:deoxyribose-phosphate aldolase